MSIRSRNLSISKTHGESTVSLTLQAVSYIHSHVWPVTCKCMRNKAGLWYVNYSSIKLFSKIKPVPAIFGAYDSGLDGH